MYKRQLQRHGRVPFEAHYVVMDPGYNSYNRDFIEDNADLLNVPIKIFESNIFDVVSTVDKSPCYLCAKMRRGYLYSKAQELGCNKIALGHHMDDVIETAIMNLFLNGNFNTFAPVTYLSRSDVKTIRPLIYVSEKELRATARENNYPVMQKCCPKDGFTKREYVKNLIADTQKEMHDIKKNIFGAIKRSNIKGWNKEI